MGFGGGMGLGTQAMNQLAASTANAKSVDNCLNILMVISVSASNVRFCRRFFPEGVHPK